MVIFVDWSVILIMLFILVNVVSAVEIGVMVICMCCWFFVVMSTVVSVIVWYMEIGIVIIFGRRKEVICSFKYNL